MTNQLTKEAMRPALCEFLSESEFHLVQQKARELFGQNVGAPELAKAADQVLELNPE